MRTFQRLEIGAVVFAIVGLFSQAELPGKPGYGWLFLFCLPYLVALAMTYSDEKWAAPNLCLYLGIVSEFFFISSYLAPTGFSTPEARALFQSEVAWYPVWKTLVVLAITFLVGWAWAAVTDRLKRPPPAPEARPSETDPGS